MSPVLRYQYLIIPDHADAATVGSALEASALASKLLMPGDGSQDMLVLTSHRSPRALSVSLYHKQ